MQGGLRGHEQTEEALQEKPDQREVTDVGIHTKLRSHMPHGYEGNK